MKNSLSDSYEHKLKKKPSKRVAINSKSSYVKLKSEEFEIFVKSWSRFSEIVYEWNDSVLENLMSDILDDKESKEENILQNVQKLMNERTRELTENNLEKIGIDNLKIHMSKIEELGIEEMMETKLELTETIEFNPDKDPDKHINYLSAKWKQKFQNYRPIGKMKVAMVRISDAWIASDT